MKPAPPRANEATTMDLLTIDEVCARLRFSRRTLQRAMADASRAGIAPAWFVLHRAVRWRAPEVNRWLDEVTTWRSSEREATRASDGGSGGALSGASLAPVAAPTARRRKPSTRRSSAPTPAASSGSLRLYAIGRVSPT
jgi:predicted DNA-binding transcriptional regulator AlpA